MPQPWSRAGPDSPCCPPLGIRKPTFAGCDPVSVQGFAGRAAQDGTRALGVRAPARHRPARCRCRLAGEARRAQYRPPGSRPGAEQEWRPDAVQHQGERAARGVLRIRSSRASLREGSALCAQERLEVERGRDPAQVRTVPDGPGKQIPTVLIPTIAAAGPAGERARTAPMPLPLPARRSQSRAIGSWRGRAEHPWPYLTVEDSDRTVPSVKTGRFMGGQQLIHVSAPH